MEVTEVRIVRELYQDGGHLTSYWPAIPNIFWPFGENMTWFLTYSVIFNFKEIFQTVYEMWLTRTIMLKNLPQV